MTVDLDPRPGRFLLTGSSRVLALRSLPDALPGRMEVIELWPFSQGEIDSGPDRFVDAAFRHGPQIEHSSALRKRDYLDRVVAGGFPEAVRRAPRRRAAFFDSYATIRTEDLAGLRNLARVAVDKFVAGYVLYTGQQTLSFGDKIKAVPIDALWLLAP
jgi:predicted AAA+ superfamily ATPase